MDGLQATGRELLIADARVGPEKLPAWKCLWGEGSPATLPDLDESPLFRTVRFYCPASPPQGQDQGPPRLSSAPCQGLSPAQGCSLSI